MKYATILIFALAFISGIFLIFRGGWPILIIGLLSILLGILYTGGPFPLGYYGLGDIFVLIFFGVVAVGGTYYLHTLSLNANVLIAGIAPGLFSTGILTVNNLRDIQSDRTAGKKTLAVRFGATFARLEYFFSILIACLIPLWLYWKLPDHEYIAVTAVVFVVAIPSIKIVFQENPGKIFNDVLANTGKILLLYSAVFSVCWNL